MTSYYGEDFHSFSQSIKGYFLSFFQFITDKRFLLSSSANVDNRNFSAIFFLIFLFFRRTSIIMLVWLHLPSLPHCLFQLSTRTFEGARIKEYLYSYNRNFSVRIYIESFVDTTIIYSVNSGTKNYLRN